MRQKDATEGFNPFTEGSSVLASEPLQWALNHRRRHVEEFGSILTETL